MAETTSLPTPEQTLLLQAALRRDAVARAAFEAWSERVDFDGLDWGSMRLVPLLHANLRKLGVEHPEMRRMEGIHRYFWSQNQLRLRRFTEVLRALRPSGVPIMVLKGIPLALGYYRSVGMRPMSDFDMLVPSRSADRILADLLESGWRLNERVSIYRGDGSIDTGARPGVGLIDDREQECDLHWHLLHDCCFEGADKGFWQHAEEMTHAGETFLAPSATDLLFHVCVHGATYNEVPTLRWAADAAMLLEQTGDRIDWQRLVTLARRRWLVLPLRNAFDYLDETLGLVIPAEARAALERSRVTFGERREYAQRIRDPHYRYSLAGRWCQLSRRHDGRGLGYKLARLPDFMQEIWSVESKWQLPHRIARVILPAYLRKLATGETRDWTLDGQSPKAEP